MSNQEEMKKAFISTAQSMAYVFGEVHKVLKNDYGFGDAVALSAAHGIVAVIYQTMAKGPKDYIPDSVNELLAKIDSKIDGGK